MTLHTTNFRPEFDDIFMELAKNLAQRSHCIKAQVGAVLTKDTRIISIGYNGPPAGTHNCDEEFPEVGCPQRCQRKLFTGTCTRNRMLFFLL